MVKVLDLLETVGLALTGDKLVERVLESSVNTDSVPLECVGKISNE